MNIDKDTKLIARLHTENNATGLNIYNPYFQDQSINAVYLLFKNQKLDPLIEGIRDLQITGAITAGFEHDSVLPSLVDELSDASRVSGRVAMIANRDGRLWAHYQGGEGLMYAIQEKVDTTEKRIVIVGAGTVAKTLILALERSNQKPQKIQVFNRTLSNVSVLKEYFSLVTSVYTLEDLKTAEGDILINASRIGSSVPDNVYTAELVSHFDVIADVTFGSETTYLTELAKSRGKLVVSGWDMFTHQAAVVLKGILNHQANIERLRSFVVQGLSTTNHGAIPAKK